MKAKLKINSNGSFTVDNVDELSYLYFPLTNYHSLKSCITPSIGGDSKIDQNSFVLLPNSIEDLHNSFMNRNMYFRINNEYTWSITGNTPYQMLNKDNVSLEADFLIHTIIRNNKYLSCKIESFVPFNDTYQELHKISLTNTSNNEITVKPVVGVPMFCRSADNLRDHRHVTALLNKVDIHENGIINKPTFSFDERGHILNNKSYGIFVHHSNGLNVKKYWPVLEEFIGEGGNLLDPIVVKKDVHSKYNKNQTITGYEVTGGFEYEEVKLRPNENFEVIISIIVDEEEEKILENVKKLNCEYYELLRNVTLESWKKELNTLTITTGDDSFDGWLKWITLQPILRRIYGCSFLPHHDYGRGGRGWRDLWQDCLTLILMNPSEVRNLLINNFLGVRIDGSNATIIGEKPGKFSADRNNISRVWMDHASWPLITTKLYIDKSGDYEFLLNEQKYFFDKFSHYTKKIVNNYCETDNILKDKFNNDYSGTILEHLIIENLVPFYNVGEHNNIRLEDADWNDALDMANERGESVAFTSLYAHNLIVLSDILEKLSEKGINKIKLLEEINILLKDIDFSSIETKKQLLNSYFNQAAYSISGTKENHNVLELSKKLKERGNYLLNHISKNEWLTGKNGSWFNGYYDNDSNPIDNVDKEHMTLTGQVFAIYGNVASKEQINEIIRSADKYLYDEEIGGYKLNTDFNELKTNMGRLFGFAFGHKENGAMFSHMAVMYANALYKRGFAHAGNKVLRSIYNHCSDINKSKIYPGIPEYIDPKGRGMYHYLTGSASWFILTQVTEVFGIKADFGDLILEPKLLKKQFNELGMASIKTLINNNLVEVEYNNKDFLDFGEYKITNVFVDSSQLNIIPTEFGVKITNLPKVYKIKVVLGNE